MPNITICEFLNNQNAPLMECLAGGLTPEIFSDPFMECLAGRLTPEIFLRFLEGYPTYWHYTHAKGRVPETELLQAERNAIQYAKQHGMILRFGEMMFRLRNDM
jgi:hypothetical protein